MQTSRYQTLGYRDLTPYGFISLQPPGHGYSSRPIIQLGSLHSLQLVLRPPIYPSQSDSNQLSLHKSVTYPTENASTVCQIKSKRLSMPYPFLPLSSVPVLHYSGTATSNPREPSVLIHLPAMSSPLQMHTYPAKLSLDGHPSFAKSSLSPYTANHLRLRQKLSLLRSFMMTCITYFYVIK